MPLIRIFVLCFVAGIAGGYLLWPRSGLAPIVAPPAEMLDVPAKPVAPLVATRETPRAAKPVARAPAPAPRLPPVESLANLEGDRDKVAELVADEKLSPVDVRVLLEQVLAGKLPRQLSTRDYDRLTNAVMRVRAAERVLRGVDESAANAELRAEHRAILSDATSEVEAITGVELSALKQIVEPGGGVTQEGNEDPATIVHETLPEASDQPAVE
jgi:hypothetical protein